MDQEQARSFIRKHLQKATTDPIVITRQLVLRWWRLLNIAIFDNRLPKPVKIRIRKLRANWAWTRESSTPFHITLTMDATYPSKRLFVIVLLHEMVHAWEHFEGHNMSHTGTFKRWKQPIYTAIGLPLTTVVEIPT